MAIRDALSLIKVQFQIIADGPEDDTTKRRVFNTLRGEAATIGKAYNEKLDRVERSDANIDSSISTVINDMDKQGRG